MNCWIESILLHECYSRGHSLIAKALGHAQRMGLVSRNVAQATQAPRASRKVMPSLTPADVPRFLEAAKETPYFTLFYTLLYTGIRRGEALALRWRNIDLAMASLAVVETAYRLHGTTVTKEPKTSHSRRQIALSPSLALLLHQHRAQQETQRALLRGQFTDDDFVFAHLPDGGVLDPSTVSRAFAKTIRRAGLPPIPLHRPTSDSCHLDVAGRRASESGLGEVGPLKHKNHTRYIFTCVTWAPRGRGTTF